MLVKPGVSLNGLHYLMWYAAAVYDYLRASNGWGEGTITGGLERADELGPERALNSRHPVGLGVDLRTRDIPAAYRRELADLMRRALGPSFDVVLESDHIHVEIASRGAV